MSPSCWWGSGIGRGVPPGSVDDADRTDEGVMGRSGTVGGGRREVGGSAPEPGEWRTVVRRAVASSVSGTPFGCAVVMDESQR